MARETEQAQYSGADRCRRLIGGVVGLSVSHPWRTLGIALFVTLAALLACSRLLGISTNTVDMLSPDVPFRQHAKAFNRAFPQQDNTILAIIDAPTPEGAAVAAETLAARVGGRGSVREVTRPGRGFLRTHGLLFLPPERLAALVDDLAAAEPMLATLARNPHLGGLAALFDLAARAETGASLAGLERLLDAMAATAQDGDSGRPGRLSWQALLAGEAATKGALARLQGTRRFVLIRPAMDFSRLKPASPAIATVRDTAAVMTTARSDGLRIRLTGEAVIEHQEMESVEAGGALAGLLSLVFVTLILGAGFREGRAVVACLATLLAGLIWTAGVAAATVGTLNLISVAFAVLFVGLGIDFCIHFALRFREDRGPDRQAALIAAGRGVGCALLLSALCAALGFFSFWPTSYRGLAELGLIAGMGMFVAVLASLTLLPALLVVLGARQVREASEPGDKKGHPRWLVRYRWVVLGGALLLGLAGAVLAPRIAFDFNPMNLRDADASSMRAFQVLTEDTATTPYVVNALTSDLDEAETLAERFRADPAFGGARTLASFVPEAQDQKLAILRDAAFFLAPVLNPAPTAVTQAPANRNAAFAQLKAALVRLAARDGAVGAAARNLQQVLSARGKSPDIATLSARWTAYLPRTLAFLREALSVDKVTRADIPADLRRDWVTAEGQARVTARPARPIQSNTAIRAFAERALAITPRATGAPVTIHLASEAVIGAFKAATAYATAAILVLLAVTLRRVRDVVFAVVPLALAALLTLSAAVLLGIPLNFANVIVLPLLLGLGVSSGIHLVLRVRGTGSVRRALASSTPQAVLLSVLTTLASFGTLIVAGHRGMSSMGALLTIAIVFILLCVLVVLPALMAAFDRGGIES